MRVCYPDPLLISDNHRIYFDNLILITVFLFFFFTLPFSVFVVKLLRAVFLSASAAAAHVKWLWDVYFVLKPSFIIIIIIVYDSFFRFTTIAPSEWLRLAAASVLPNNYFRAGRRCPLIVFFLFHFHPARNAHVFACVYTLAIFRLLIRVIVFFFFPVISAEYKWAWTVVFLNLPFGRPPPSSGSWFQRDFRSCFRNGATPSAVVQVPSRVVPGAGSQLRDMLQGADGVLGWCVRPSRVLRMFDHHASALRPKRVSHMQAHTDQG